jgi:hypothetical protein
MCSAHGAIVARRWAGPARGEGGALSCGGPCSGFQPVHSTRCVPRHGYPATGYGHPATGKRVAFRNGLPATT